jgi:hypothetical protein
MGARTLTRHSIRYWTIGSSPTIRIGGGGAPVAFGFGIRGSGGKWGRRSAAASEVAAPWP